MKTILLRKIKKTLHRSVGCVSLCAFHEKNAYLEIYFLLHRYLNPGNSCQILILTTRDLNAGLIKKNIRDCYRVIKTVILFKKSTLDNTGI